MLQRQEVLFISSQTRGFFKDVDLLYAHPLLLSLEVP